MRSWLGWVSCACLFLPSAVFGWCLPSRRTRPRDTARFTGDIEQWWLEMNSGDGLEEGEPTLDAMRRRRAKRRAMRAPPLLSAEDMTWSIGAPPRSERGERPGAAPAPRTIASFSAGGDVQ